MKNSEICLEELGKQTNEQFFVLRMRRYTIVEPVLYGPFVTELTRDAMAIKMRREDPNELKDVLLQLNLQGNIKNVTVENYSKLFLNRTDAKQAGEKTYLMAYYCEKCDNPWTVEHQSTISDICDKCQSVVEPHETIEL
jgi:hypothetical protein